MTADALVAPLKDVPIFQGLQLHQLAMIARAGERMVYKAGDVIIREGTAGDAAVLVVSGDSARIEGPVRITGEELVPQHALIGEMAMLVESQYGSTVVAKGQVRALKFTRAALYELMARDASLAEHFVAKLAARLQHLATELRSIDQALEMAVQLPRQTASLPAVASTAVLQ